MQNSSCVGMPEEKYVSVSRNRKMQERNFRTVQLAAQGTSPVRVLQLAIQPIFLLDPVNVSDSFDPKQKTKTRSLIRDS